MAVRSQTELVKLLRYRSRPLAGWRYWLSFRFAVVEGLSRNRQHLIANVAAR